MKAKYDQLNAVVCSYNRNQYQRDEITFDMRDCWRPLGFAENGKGDCEDFALGYYYKLQTSGWKNEDISLALCKLYGGQMHVVTLVNTENGTFALDCRHRFALPYRSRVLNIAKWYSCGGSMDAEWRNVVQPSGILPQGMKDGAPVSETVKCVGVSAIPHGLVEFQEFMRGQYGTREEVTVDK